MYRNTAVEEIPGSNAKKKRREKKKKRVPLKNQRSGRRRPSKASRVRKMNERNMMQQNVTPSSPPLFQRDGLIGSIIRPFFPSTPPGSDNDSEDDEPGLPPVRRSSPPVRRSSPPVRRSSPPVSLENHPYLQISRGKKPVQPRVVPRRKSLLRSTIKNFRKNIKQVLKPQLRQGYFNLKAYELIRLAEGEGFQRDDSATLKKQTLAAVEYLRSNGLTVKLGDTGWDILDKDNFDESEWDYMQKLRF